MKECIEILENKILYLDKEIYKLKEEEWKVKFIDEIIENLENLPNYMLGLASILPLTDYIELENLYASISIYKKKNQSKIVFDLDEINRKIKNILNKEKIKIEDNYKKIKEYQDLEFEIKHVILSITYNSHLNSKDYEIILESLGNLSNERKANILNELNYYSTTIKDDLIKSKISELINAIDFNLKIVPRYENVTSEKRKLIYSSAPNMFKILRDNNYNGIEDLLIESFETYNLNDNDKALFTSLLLEYIYKELKDYKSIFLNEGFYIDKDSSIEIINNYTNLKNAYDKIYNMYLGYTEIASFTSDKRKLEFAYFSKQNTKARVLDDIEAAIKSDSLDLIQARNALHLIEGYINKSPKIVFEAVSNMDSCFKIKLSSGGGSGAGRLKKPRLLIKKDGTNFVIIGFFLKSDEKGNKEYRSLCNRDYVLNPEQDEITTENILNLLNERIENKKNTR